MSKIRLLLVLCALMLGAAPARAQGFVVIVNSANPTTTLQRAKANGIFLRRIARWDDGRAMVPVNLSSDAPAREAFSKAIHGRGVSAIVSHWQQQIFAGREAPPAERDDDARVMAFVSANPGAIGYVSTRATLTEGVKAIAVN